MLRKILGIFGAAVIAAVSLFPARADVPYVTSVPTTLGAASVCVQINPLAGQTSATLSITGTHSLSITTYGVTGDGTTEVLNTTTGSSSVSSNGQYHYQLNTYKIVRSCVSSYSSGSAVAILSASAATGTISATISGGVPTPIPTQVPTPIATATTGYAPPAVLPQTIDYLQCVYTGLSAAPTLGNTVVCQTDSQGAIYVHPVGPTATPYATSNPNVLQADVTQGGGLVQANPTISPQPQVTAIPVLDHLLVSNGTGWTPACVTSTANCNTPLSVGQCQGANCTNVSATSSATLGSVEGTDSIAFLYAYNGGNSSRLQGDPAGSNAGIGNLWVTTGGSGYATAAPTAAAVVIKATPGRLARITIIVAGTSSVTCYNNATTTSGQVIGITPATTSIGQQYTFDTIATVGITCSVPTSTGPTAGFTFY